MLTAVLLIPLLAIVGLVIDVGYSYYTQRSLQASADAAALAGAQNLPDANKAMAVAGLYGASAGAKNDRSRLANTTETITTKCLASVGPCLPVNGVVVDEQAQVQTLFTRVLGVNTFTVHARATACSPCGERPLDVMLIFDRTLSMCMDFYGNWDASCTKLNNARAGMKAFLNVLDPATDHVGLAVLPPALSLGSNCTKPGFGSYDSPNSPYVLVPLSSDYKINGQLNSSSNLVSTINCLPADGETSYATAIEQGQAELDRHGRPNVDKIIVFFTDGAANTGPAYYPMSSPYRKQPCHQGIASADAAKAKGTTIYTVGYTLNGLGGFANRCQAYSYNGPDEQPPITAYTAVQLIASDPSKFYSQPTIDQLTTIFSQIAIQISAGASRLVDNNTQ